MSEIDLLRERVRQLEIQLANEQAQRVHLRDKVSRANSTAYRTLNEGVLYSLVIAAKAIEREDKRDVAKYNIELAIENIREALPTFCK